MTATITAIHADPGAGSLASPTTESTLQDFITNLQNGAISEPQLANPATLASELFSGLRGYFERGQNLERALRSEKKAITDRQNRGISGGDGVQLALMSVPDELQTPRLHSGPARESLESDGDALAAVRMSPADIRRLSDLLVASAAFSNEGYFLAQEVSQVGRSVNILLRGQ
jgi:hypothetical protein